MLKQELHARYKATKNTDLTYGEFCYWQGKSDGLSEGRQSGQTEMKDDIFAVLKQLVDEHSIDRTTLIERVRKMIGDF